MKYSKYSLTGIIGLALCCSSCSKKVLDETPNSLTVSTAYSTPVAFDNAIAGLHHWAQYEISSQDNTLRDQLIVGTDETRRGDLTVTGNTLFDYTQLNSSSPISAYWWNIMYQGYIPYSNAIISQAEKNTDVKWINDAQKQAVIAEARFFRAYAYYYLANLFGAVPIITDQITVPKFDFTRSPVADVLNQAKTDLEFAVQYLPAKAAKPGRIVKAAAEQLLTDVYLELGDNDDAVQTSSDIINSGLYSLMTSRFGSEAANPGDVYSDLFKFQNQNLAANTETIWAVQYEYLTPGGGGDYGAKGNSILRAYGARYWALLDPDGKSGMIVDPNPNYGMGRGVAWESPTSYMRYDIWTDPNDIRNSAYNIRRDYYYNNPASAYFGQKVIVSPTTDTLEVIIPTFRKVEGIYQAGPTTGRDFTDYYKMRLAETYLLRAEAYFKKADLADAAADINVVRARSNAAPVDPSEVTLDYILDERARELYIEEPRRITLNRMGVLLDRTKRFNPEIGPTMQDFNVLLPIPQGEIDGNTGAKLDQNAGY